MEQKTETEYNLAKQYLEDHYIQMKRYNKDYFKELTLFFDQKSNELCFKVEGVFDELKLKKDQLTKEQDRFEEMTARMNEIGNNHDEILNLDVGGMPFSVQRKLM